VFLPIWNGTKLYVTTAAGSKKNVDTPKYRYCRNDQLVIIICYGL